ncbi:hypothetical protein [Thalassospira sp. MCCC 1A03138]|uniref:hypothetical protein n=1 Tax=Thalassospira sp. MCCC 1A03138 TaxID=1470576 RepID=UPI000A1FFE70|nr:hypothetical protein [Thalassospira sp. MCCC 1A03138]OSQ29014.1 hypothetical protein TH468_15960 [Thalassospira sp. MCCC 1A03138]
MEPNIVTASSVLGAVIGAASTQLFLLVKEDLAYRRRQVRAINGALAASAAVCDSVLQLKVQHLNKIQSFISRENEKLDELLERSEINGDVDQIHIELEYINLPRISPPIEELSAILHKDLDASGSMLLYFYAIVRAFKVLEATLENYNNLIDGWISNQSNDHEDSAYRFLGRHLQSGYTDTRHVDFVQQMEIAVISCAAYSYLLVEELSQKGNRLKNSFFFRKPKINSLDFAVYRRSGDFPEEEYISNLRQH